MWALAPGLGPRELAVNESRGGIGRFRERRFLLSTRVRRRRAEAASSSQEKLAKSSAPKKKPPPSVLVGTNFVAGSEGVKNKDYNPYTDKFAKDWSDPDAERKKRGETLTRAESPRSSRSGRAAAPTRATLRRPRFSPGCARPTSPPDRARLLSAQPRASRRSAVATRTPSGEAALVSWRRTGQTPRPRRSSRRSRPRTRRTRSKRCFRPRARRCGRRCRRSA